MKRTRRLSCLFIGASVALLGVDAGWWTVRSAAAETEYRSRNEVVRVTGPNSLVAAGLMGAQGFSTVPFVPKDQSFILGYCQNQSPMGNYWFNACSPAGMATTLTDNFASQHWVTRTFSGTGARTKLDAINYVGAAIASPTYRSPVALPLFGRGDHWVTVGAVKVVQTGSTVTDVNWLYFHDAVQTMDGAGHPAYTTAWTSGDDFGTNKYFKVLDVIGPACPPCSDDFLNKYVLLFEPPPGFSLLVDAAPRSELRFTRARPLITSGETMTADRATREVRRALDLTTLPGDPALQEILRTGAPAPAYQVVGRLPQGVVRNYFVVPIVDATAQNALAFVELDAIDGAVLSVSLPSEHFAFRPIAAQQAMQVALSQLQPGERLGEPVLRWDSRELHQAAQQPFQAFYEMAVLRGDSATTEVIRVALNGGIAIGRTAHGQ